MNPSRIDVDRHRAERGFTVVELLVAMVITIVVLAVLTNLLVVSNQAGNQTQESSRSSEAEYTATTYFDADVAAASKVDGTDPVRRGVTGCGNTQSVVVLVGPGVDTAVQVRSYDVISEDGLSYLERRTCTGTSVSGAVSSSPSIRRVAQVETGSVTVHCDSDDTTPPGGDALCRKVRLSFVTQTGRNVAVEGTLTSVLAPTPTTTPTPAVAPTTGTCTILASETTWGATGGYAGSSSANHANDPLMYTYNDTNEDRSYLYFDLTQPCADTSPDWPTLPGGRSLTSVKLQLAYMGHNNAYCWIFPGISYDPQKIEALDSSAIWSEATLTGDNMPGAIRGGTYHFNRGNQGSLTTHINSVITDAVTHWYDGSWANRGFRLARDGVGDTCGRASTWASRSNGNASLRPRLVITWGTP
ncbi:MAG: DNRLRE domain-containing protein [Acidimicrobiales bacterium]|nr:DNRLRE domain-containing protein [Acidimicrobiales bacterium]